MNSDEPRLADTLYTTYSDLMPELPETVYRDLINRLGAAKMLAEEINDMLAFKDDPVGVIFWWSEPNIMLDDEAPKDLLFDKKEHDRVRRAARALVYPNY